MLGADLSRAGRPGGPGDLGHRRQPEHHARGAVRRAARRPGRRPRLRRHRVRRRCGRRADPASGPGRPVPGGRGPPGRPGPVGPAPGRPGHRRRAAGGRHHRLAGQDLDQGPAQPGAGDGRADGGPGRQPQQRARRPAHGEPDRRADAVPGRRDGRPGHRPHRLPVRHRTADRRGGAQRRARPRRRVRRAGGDRPGQGRAGRGAAGRRRGGAQRRRPAGLGHAGAHGGLRAGVLGRGSAGRARRLGLRPRQRPVRSLHLPAARRRPAVARGRTARPRSRCRSRVGTRSATRWPRPRRPWPSVSTCGRWRPGWPPPPRAPGGGWSCTSGATASPSSTTRTTPTRTRWPPRSARWPS